MCEDGGIIRVKSRAVEENKSEGSNLPINGKQGCLLRVSVTG